MVDVHEHGNPTEERSFGATFLFPMFFPFRVSSAPFALFPRVILAPVLNRAYSWSTTFSSLFHLILAQPIASRSRNGKGVRRGWTNAFPNRLGFTHEAVLTSQRYGLFTTTCGPGLLISSLALTFWIWAACSSRRAVSCAIVAPKSFFSCVIVACCSSTFLCSLRNSLSNITLMSS